MSDEATKPKPRMKQGHFKGMAPRTIKEIDDAADAYYEAIQARLPFTKQEAEAKEALIAVMKKHKKTVYKTASQRNVNLEETEKVTVRPAKPEATIDEKE